MSRIPPVEVDSLAPEERQLLQRAGELMGFQANDGMVMARNPRLLHAFAGLVGAIYEPSKLEPGLKRMIGLVTSQAAGCRYCMGHTVFGGEKYGVEAEKLAAIWSFERSELFSDRERSALRVALHAGQSPSGVTDDMFATLDQFFDEDEKLEIVAVISMFGFLNRWNSTLATELEALPGEALLRSAL